MRCCLINRVHMCVLAAVRVLLQSMMARMPSCCAGGCAYCTLYSCVCWWAFGLLCRPYWNAGISTETSAIWSHSQPKVTLMVPRALFGLELLPFTCTL